MARKSKKAGGRLPKAVEFLADLTEEEAAAHSPVVLLKRDDGGYARYWREGGQVRCGEADSAAGESRPGALEALLASGRRNFEGLLPKLSAEMRGPSPNLDIIETAFRDGALGSGAAALGALLESVDRELPAPACESCGAAMQRHQRKSKRFTTRFGPVEVERTYYRCPDCGDGHFPFDRKLGIEGVSHTPGAASIIADAVADGSSYEAASRKLANVAGVPISPTELRRKANGIGGRGRRFEREAVEAGDPPAARTCLSIDGTKVPVGKVEAEGVREPGSRARNLGDSARTVSGKRAKGKTRRKFNHKA